MEPILKPAILKELERIFNVGDLIQVNPYSWNRDVNLPESVISKIRLALWKMNCLVTLVHPIFVTVRWAQINGDATQSIATKVYMQFAIAVFIIGLVMEMVNVFKREEFITLVRHTLQFLKKYKADTLNSTVRRRWTKINLVSLRFIRVAITLNGSLIALNGLLRPTSPEFVASLWPHGSIPIVVRILSTLIFAVYIFNAWALVVFMPSIVSNFALSLRIVLVELRSDDELGVVNFPPVVIDTGDKKPFHKYSYRLAHLEKQVLDELVERNLKLGVIEPCVSPYNSQVFVVPKKRDEHGNLQHRVCVDLRELNDQKQDQEKRQPRRVRQSSPSTLSFDLGEELPENPIPLLDLLQNQVPAIHKWLPVAAIIQEEIDAARSPQRSQPRSTQQSSQEEFIPSKSTAREVARSQVRKTARSGLETSAQVQPGVPILDSQDGTIICRNGHELILPPLEPPNMLENPRSITAPEGARRGQPNTKKAVPPKVREEPYSQLTKYYRGQASIEFQLIPTGAETADLVTKQRPQALPIPEEFVQPSVTKSGTDSGSKTSLGDRYVSVSSTASGLETGPANRAKESDTPSSLNDARSDYFCPETQHSSATFLKYRDSRQNIPLNTLAKLQGSPTAASTPLEGRRNYEGLPDPLEENDRPRIFTHANGDCSPNLFEQRMDYSPFRMPLTNPFSARAETAVPTSSLVKITPTKIESSKDSIPLRKKGPGKTKIFDQNEENINPRDNTRNSGTEKAVRNHMGNSQEEPAPEGRIAETPVSKEGVTAIPGKSKMRTKLSNDPTLDFLLEESVSAARFYGCSPTVTYQAQLCRVKTEFRDNIIPTDTVLDRYRKEFFDTYLELAKWEVHRGLRIQLYDLKRRPRNLPDYSPALLGDDLEGLRSYKLPEWDRFRALHRVLTLRPDDLPKKFCISCGPAERCNTPEEVCLKGKSALEERDREGQVILDALEFFAGKEAHWGSTKIKSEAKPTTIEVDDLEPPSGSNSTDTAQDDCETEAWVIRGEAMSIHRENPWAQCALCLVKTPTLASLVEHMKSHAESESD
ncbi:unnamed protein product [Allacma fusca]|uniref:Uncharacterized protein n=1 Tax=Allacma fusca TaxID=39272 RepID=A0A8J2NSQ5_9HEXA|nr:unnamed protein product [Allacma fusca]